MIDDKKKLICNIYALNRDTVKQEILAQTYFSALRAGELLA